MAEFARYVKDLRNLEFAPSTIASVSVLVLRALYDV